LYRWPGEPGGPSNWVAALPSATALEEDRRGTNEVSGTASGCVICGKLIGTQEHFIGSLDGGPMLLLQVCPDEISSPRIVHLKDELDKEYTIGGINLKEPVRVTPGVAESIARYLSTPDPDDDEDDLGYPGTTAEQVMTELGKRGDILRVVDGGRDDIGNRACGWLRDAMNEGAVFADAEGILAAKS
jgi:hypothetical protein